MNDSTPHEHAHHGPSPYVIFGILLGLLVATVAVYYVDLGTLGLAVAMGIAIAKAGLILTYFMHLLHEQPLTRLFAASGFASLAILLIILLADVASRMGT